MLNIHLALPIIPLGRKYVNFLFVVCKQTLTLPQKYVAK